MSNIPNTFTSGTKAKSSEVNANFVYLENEVINERTELSGDYEVLSGCLVTVNDPADTAINIALGKVLINGLIVNVAAQLNEALSAADVSNPRYDVICVDDTGVISVITGTPAATPVVPTLTADKCPLATILRPAGNNNALAANLYDGRYFRNKPYTTSNLTFVEASGGSSGEWLLKKTLTIPPFVNKKFLRLEMDYSGYLDGDISDESGSVDETRDNFRILLNDVEYATISQSARWWYNLSGAIYRNYFSCTSGIGVYYLTEDDGVDFEQFTTIKLQIWKKLQSTSSGADRVWLRFEKTNTTFSIIGE